MQIVAGVHCAEMAGLGLGLGCRAVVLVCPWRAAALAHVF